jgi:hypothetical protein
MIRTLNAELLLALRSSVGADALRGPLDEGLAALDDGIARLEKDAADAGAIEHLRAGRDRIRRLRDAHLAADALLQRVEAMARTDSIDPRELTRILSRHAATAGQICVELAAIAAKEGDTARARRLLGLAASIDPGKRDLYEKKAAELGEPR